MKNTLILSIILPLFKGEKFIETCVKYLYKQDIDYNEYEIIIVNDGSPDNSAEIIQELLKTCTNIVYIHTENKGVGSARNTALDIAKGEWITFIDHDDIIRIGSLKDIKQVLVNSKDDIIKFSIEDLNSTNLNTKLINGLGPKLIDSIDGIEFYHKYRSMVIYTGFDASWSIFYKAEFINKYNLRFVPGIVYMEDAEFLGRVFCLARSCSLYDYPYYLHNDNPDSISNSKVIFSEKAVQGFITGAVNLKNFKNNDYLDENQKVFLNNPIAKLVLLVLQQTVNSKCLNIKYYHRLFKELKNNNLTNIGTEGCSSELVFWVKIFNLSLHLFVLLWFINLSIKSISSRIIPLYKPGQ